MKVFVYEYCCSQPLHSEATAQALRGEGLAMLSALMTDLAGIAGIEPMGLLADDFPPVAFPSQRIGVAAEEQAYRRLAAASDWTIVIAPEIDGILEERCRQVIDAGGRLLGPGLDAVRLTADKLALAGVLKEHRVPTPDTFSLGEMGWTIDRRLLPGVCKPRFGAGSTSTYLVNTVEDLERIKQAEPHVDFILQKLVEGIPASVAVLIGSEQRVTLMPAKQSLSSDGQFHYLGGRAPLSSSLAERARRLALAAVKTVPGLFGYVGVDLVLGRTRGQVIEINPRLTTSYVGLRKLCRTNLAAALLDVAEGRSVRLEWGDSSVCWTPHGETSVG